MEILAPAGNMNALKAAVACGADAVYLGTTDFSARSKANFSDEELRLAVLYCHDRGVRVYVAFNTIIKDKEIPIVIESARKAIEIGADAFLIQDLGLYTELNKTFPNAVYFASTQMGIHNVYGAKFAEKMGFDRVVLSREVLSEDIKKIKENTNLEIELFAHGAHCVSFSGNCYFSAMVSGYSGNRGKCLQLCRKKYTLTGGGRNKTGYMLSAKDICMLGNIEKLKTLGVDSLKIEGRLRSAEYAATTSEVYKRAVSCKIKDSDIISLKTVFNRGDFSEAYINDDKAEIIYDKQQNHIGIKVAKISATRGNKLVLREKFNRHVGDGYKILRGGTEVGSAHDEKDGIVFEGKVCAGDELRLTKSGEISNYVKNRIKANKQVKAQNFTKIPRKNHCTMPDIVCNKLILPDRCRIFTVSDDTSETLIDNADMVIYSPSEYSLEAVNRFINKCKKPVILDLPIEARGNDVAILEAIVKENIFCGYVANNVYALELCKNYPVILGPEMNSVSSRLFPKISSYEAAYSGTGDVLLVFGRVPLMNFTHCPKKQLGFNCSDCSKCTSIELTDEIKNEFTIRRQKIHYCYFQLLNSKIQNLLPKIDWKKQRRLLYDLRDIDEEYSARVISGDFAFDERINTYGRFGKGVK